MGNTTFLFIRLYIQYKREVDAEGVLSNVRVVLQSLCKMLKLESLFPTKFGSLKV